MLIYHKGHTDTIQVYSVTVMTHVKALQAGHSSQGTSEPITPGDMNVTVRGINTTSLLFYTTFIQDFLRGTPRQDVSCKPFLRRDNVSELQHLH